MRLINADEFIKRLSGKGELFNDKKTSRQFIEGIKKAIEVADFMPTADNYMHGHMIENHGRPIWYQCSVCMCRIPKGSMYCNSCGARLDEEVEVWESRYMKQQCE